ncbi:MAG: hypothetical protein ABL860_09135 [Candidatus Nitrotoga sp.]
MSQFKHAELIELPVFGASAMFGKHLSEMMQSRSSADWGYK